MRNETHIELCISFYAPRYVSFLIPRRWVSHSMSTPNLFSRPGGMSLLFRVPICPNLFTHPGGLFQLSIPTATLFFPCPGACTVGFHSLSAIPIITATICTQIPAFILPAKSYRDVRRKDVRHRDVRHSDVRHSDVRHSDVRHSDVRHRAGTKAMLKWVHPTEWFWSLDNTAATAYVYILDMV